MKNKQKMMITMMLAALLVQGTVVGQMAANPAGAQGMGEWTVSASTSTLKHVIGAYDSQTQRHLLKSAWGILPFVDFYITAGGIKLEMEPSSDPLLDDYEGQFKLGYGSGLKLNLLDEKKSGFGIWVDANVLRFKSDGSFKQLQMIDGMTYTRKSAMTYDWREFRVSPGITIPVKKVKIYAAAALFNVWRKDEKKEYLYSGSDSKQYLGQKNGEYKSGNWTGGLAGVEIALPDGYRLSVEAMGLNKKNYQILVGISQTGIRQW